MKKIYLIISMLLLFTCIAIGQEANKNNTVTQRYFLSGQVSHFTEDHNRSNMPFYGEKSDIEKIIFAGAKFGYIINNTWALGISAGVKDFENAYINNVALRGSSMSYGLFGRYMHPGTNKISWFVETNLIIEYAIHLKGFYYTAPLNGGPGEIRSYSRSFHSRNLNLNFGIKYNITPTTQFELRVFNFNYIWYKESGFQNRTQLSYCIIEPNIGLSFKF